LPPGPLEFAYSTQKRTIKPLGAPLAKNVSRKIDNLNPEGGEEIRLNSTYFLNIALTTR